MSLTMPVYASKPFVSYVTQEIKYVGTSSVPGPDGPDIDDAWSFLDKHIGRMLHDRDTSHATNSGSIPPAVIPQPAIEANKTVCKGAQDALDSLPASNQKRLARSLLSAIHSQIMEEWAYREMTPFHPIKLVPMDDGTILLSWAYRNGRLSFYIDPEIDDSQVVYLSRLIDEVEPEMSDEPISANNVHVVAARSVQFASRLA